MEEDTRTHWILIYLFLLITFVLRHFSTSHVDNSHPQSTEGHNGSEMTDSGISEDAERGEKKRAIA